MTEAGVPQPTARQPVRAGNEVQKYHRAWVDVVMVQMMTGLLLRHDPTIRFNDLWAEHGEALWDLPDIGTVLDQPADAVLRGFRSMIEAGLVVTYMRPFTRGDGAGYPLSVDDVIPESVRGLHDRIAALRHKVYGHLDDDDSPAPRWVERFVAIEDGGVERHKFQERSTAYLDQRALQDLRKLAGAVAEKLDALLRDAKAAELAASGRCARCGARAVPDTMPDRPRCERCRGA